MGIDPEEDFYKHNYLAAKDRKHREWLSTLNAGQKALIAAAKHERVMARVKQAFTELFVKKESDS